jgi:hypothetical protein
MNQLKLKYRRLKRNLNLNDEMVAKMFGYKNSHSFITSARKDKVITGIIQLLEQVAPEFTGPRNSQEIIAYKKGRRNKHKQ